jgi:hypothetical protein
VTTPNPAPRPADEPPGQIQWERNPRGCSSIGCLYAAVGIFVLLLIAMVLMGVLRAPPPG